MRGHVHSHVTDTRLLCTEISQSETFDKGTDMSTLWQNRLVQLRYQKCVDTEGLLSATAQIVDSSSGNTSYRL